LQFPRIRIVQVPALSFDLVVNSEIAVRRYGEAREAAKAARVSKQVGAGTTAVEVPTAP
jgi:hypothetical protein